MAEQLSAIGLAVATLDRKADSHTATLADILHAFQAVTAGQSHIMGSLDMLNRGIAAINAALAQEPDGENLADLLRTILVQLGSTSAELRLAVQRMADMPGEVANVLHADGLTADQPQC